MGGVAKLTPEQEPCLHIAYRMPSVPCYSEGSCHKDVDMAGFKFTAWRAESQWVTLTERSQTSHDMFPRICTHASTSDPALYKGCACTQDVISPHALSNMHPLRHTLLNCWWRIVTKSLALKSLVLFSIAILQKAIAGLLDRFSPCLCYLCFDRFVLRMP